MKFLGLDYGGKKIGIAVSDADGKIAFPREELKNDSHTLERIKKIATDEKIDTIVTGDTRSLSGENPITKEAEEFFSSLEKEGIRVERSWEAWSSIEASRYAPKGQEHNDAAAAAIILQRFLDSRSRT